MFVDSHCYLEYFKTLVGERNIQNCLAGSPLIFSTSLKSHFLALCAWLKPPPPPPWGHSHHRGVELSSSRWKGERKEKQESKQSSSLGKTWWLGDSFLTMTVNCDHSYDTTQLFSWFTRDCVLSQGAGPWLEWVKGASCGCLRLWKIKEWLVRIWGSYEMHFDKLVQWKLVDDGDELHERTSQKCFREFDSGQVERWEAIIKRSIGINHLRILRADEGGGVPTLTIDLGGLCTQWVREKREKVSQSQIQTTFEQASNSIHSEFKLQHAGGEYHGVSSVKELLLLSRFLWPTNAPPPRV